MKIELRKISHHKALSQETPAYTAQVWVDGKHFCDVANQGRSGADEQYAPRPARQSERVTVHAAIRDLDARIAAEYPKIDCATFGGAGTMCRNLETVYHEMLAEIEVTKDLRRLLGRTVAFKDGDGKIRSYTGRHDSGIRTHLIAKTRNEKPRAVILNELPFDEALAIYKSSAAA